MAFAYVYNAFIVSHHAILYCVRVNIDFNMTLSADCIVKDICRKTNHI